VSWIRLRQVALVAHDLDAVVADLHEAFGLVVAVSDPAVAAFGLRNVVLPVGDQFVEVVSPTREGTAGGRQLARLGGDGGYMVICHTDDHPAVRRRVRELGVRTVLEADEDGYRIMQLHPSDTGGSFLEIDFQPGGEDPGGPWMPAGEGWQRARRTDVVDGIAAVTLQCRDPDATAARWSAITGLAVTDGVLQLDGADVEFVDGPLDALVGVTLTATDRARAGTERTVSGVRFTLR
jgi:catechol 2,3-dioxygenase-like lactoylglutathione lyase family enzyme